MRWRPGIGVWGMLLLSLLAPGSATGDPTTAVDQPRLQQWLRRLGDDNYGTREAAARELTSWGEAALPVLRETMVRDRDFEVRQQAKRVHRAILRELCSSKSTGMKFVVVESGSFLMGSPANESNRRDDEPQHVVRITRTFLLGAHEVTQAEFFRLMEFQPSSFAGSGADKIHVLDRETGSFPVESVSWFDAVEFCNRLSKAEGYAPYYVLSNLQYEAKSIKGADVVTRGGNGFRLPTEAEWEFACRAGSSWPYHFGSGGTGREANCKPGPSVGYGGSPQWKTLDRTAKVGSYPANLWGLCDMHGNVNEWCADWYDRNSYQNDTTVDPAGPKQGTHRVARGGSWLVMESSCRSASRLMMSPDSRTNYVGFRVARSP